MYKAITVLLWLCLMVALCAQSSEPILRINTEMHTAKINRISTDANERYVLTCSNDKSGRLWDASSGNLLRVLRPPIGADDEGMLNACALSPDGRIAALGGWTGWDWDGYCYVYLFNAQSGAMLQRISGFPNVIQDLEFSPDGSYLAVALCGANGVRIYRTADWTLAAKLDGYQDRVTNVAFRPGGGFASVCNDGRLRLYDAAFKLTREQDFDFAQQPYSLTFSPDGKAIAVGFEDSPRVQVLDASSLRLLYEPDISGAESVVGGLDILCFSRDGSKLYAGGQYQVISGNAWKWVVRCWDNAGKGAYSDHPVAGSTIMDIKPRGDSGIIFAGFRPDWGCLQSSGSLSLYASAETNDLGAKDKSHLRVSYSATEVGFTPYGGSPNRFQIAARALTHSQSSAPSSTDRLGDISVSDWDSSYAPRINGEAATFLRQYERCFSTDISASPERIVFGASWNLYCLDYAGKTIWSAPTQAMAAAVNISGDGRTVVAAMNDGTIRWYRMSDGTLLLTLFAHPDGKRWIVYTPGGFYDCAVGSESLIGWHVNNGKDSEAFFYPVAQFRERFYRPDVIARVLDTLDEAEALRLSDSEANRKPTGTSIVGQYPPIIRITSPNSGSGFSGTDITLEYSIANYSGEPLTGLKVLLDGRPADGQKGIAELTKANGSLRVTLPKRDLRVGLIASNKYGASELVEVSLLWQGKEKEAVYKPNLYVLAVGIDSYASKELKLRYSAKDARDFAAVMQAQQGRMYNKVETRLLVDKDAGVDQIRDGFEWILKQTTSKDVAMIFLSGHGISGNFGQFYYLPVNADLNRVLATCLPFSDITNTAERVPGNIVVFVDACHAGLMYDKTRKAPDPVGMANEFTRVTNAAIFMSCSAYQYSLESDEWKNGAFTKALVEGLSGKADTMNKGRVSVTGLLYYIAERVKELTENAQTPVLGNPASFRDFDLGMSGK
jgi:WD40 repeat protein